MRYIRCIGCLMLAVFIFSGCLRNGQKRLDERITLNKKDRIPYGTWYAYQYLGELFPYSAIYENSKSPAQKHNGNWMHLDWLVDGVATDTSRSLYMVITDNFAPDENDWEAIWNFASDSNYVWINASAFGKRVMDSLSIKTGWSQDSSGQLKTRFLSDKVQQTFTYPGEGAHAWFDHYDADRWEVLAVDQNDRAVFLQSKKGCFGGRQWRIQSTPLTMSNFFLLHKKNKAYYDQLTWYFMEEVDAIIWDDYFRKPVHNNDFNAWSTITKSPALGGALLMAIVGGLLYLLSEAKRRQREIPPVETLQNSSVDFVKTVGRLYYQRHDNFDLSVKMLQQFRERAKNKFNIHVSRLDTRLEKTLLFKSGQSAEEVRQLVARLREVDEGNSHSDEALLELNDMIEKFFNTRL